MSDMKCPFCQQEVNQDNPQSIECRNDDCKKSYFMYGSKELWQELIRTRKALNHCIKIFHQLEDVLDEKSSLRDFDDPDLYAWAVQIKPIWLELKEITGIDYKTTLEQKDVKC